MISLPIISIVFCIAYVVFILFRFGVPVSLSETYYLLSNKWDWMFSAWCVLTATPLGIYWTIDTMAKYPSMTWIPITCVIAMLFIGVSCRYKSGPKNEDSIVKGDIEQPKKYSVKKKNVKEFFVELLAKFKPSEFLKYGWARPIHYFNSILLITLTTIYVCVVNPVALYSTIFLYVMFILIGLKVDGVYNKDYSADVDNKAWIFFMEVICFIQMFVYLLPNWH